MATLTEPQAIVQLRIELDDNILLTSTDPPPSHLAIDEPMLGAVNGTNTTFRVRHIPILGTSPTAVVVRDQNYATVAVTSVALTTGVVTLTTAPASGKTMFAQYNYAYVTDETFKRFFQQGYRFLNASGITSVAENLYPALFAFVKYLYYLQLSTKSGDFFDSSVGEKSVNKSMIPAHYFEMATETKAEAFKLRDDVKTGQGDQLRPAYGFVAPRQTVYTPPR